MNHKAKVGRRGEELVCDWLLRHGHTILERNWRSSHLELDIVSRARDGIHFVEVKSRVAPLAASPQENVGGLKQHRVAKAAQHYLAMKGEQDTEAWLDVATVVFDGEDAIVEYMPNAYVPIYYG
ncbi:MAG: YraN family protein [Bacteroidales bacterium]|nr:YraN family protein [Bacteroidales bacterium]